tara:strand:- start:176 stop:799 length:624 start_codon:yes stop_codon:yes gene_type:complete
MQNGKILRTNRLAGLFALLMNLSVAEFLVQGSYSMQVNDTITRMSGYDVKYSDVGSNVSPYDISLGYMFSFRDVAVMPVMVEGKTTTIESYLNTEAISEENLAPLEVLIKPGLRLTDSDVYFMLGYQLGSFTQKIEVDGHDFELVVKPNFYGVGYSKGLSDYLDYLAEVKVYYQSEHSYAINMDTQEIDPNLVISDAKVRVGLRIRI